MITGSHFETCRATVRRAARGLACGLVLCLWSSAGFGATDEGTANGGDGGFGIFGTVSQVDELVVNGLSITPASEASISVEGEAGTLEDLKVGNVVAIEAREVDGAVLADRITIQHAVAGPIGRTDPTMRRLEILGQPVKIAAGVRPEQSGGDFDAFEAGQLVRVSGLRRVSGLIEATRIEVVAEGTEAALRGPISEIDGSGFSIGGQRVEVSDGALLEGLSVNDKVAVSGTLSADTLSASNVRREPRRPFDGRFKRVSLEGFLARGDDEPLSVAGHDWNQDGGVRFDGMSSDQLRFGRRLIVEGELADGDKLEVTPRVVRAPDVGRTGAYAGSRAPQSAVGVSLRRSRSTTGDERSPRMIIRRGDSPEPNVKPGFNPSPRNQSRLRIQRPVRPNYTNDPTGLPPGGRRPPRWRQRGDSVRGGPRVRRR